MTRWETLFQFLSYLLHSCLFFPSGVFSFVCGASIDPAGDFIGEVNFWAVNKRWAAAESSGINQKLPSYRDRWNINVEKSHNPAAILTDHNVSRRKPHWLGISQNELSDSLLHQGSKGISAIDRLRDTASEIIRLPLRVSPNKHIYNTEMLKDELSFMHHQPESQTY